MRPRAEAAGFMAFDAGIAIDAAFSGWLYSSLISLTTSLHHLRLLGWYLPHLFGEVLTPAMLGDLESLVLSWRPDVVLHETWEFAGPIAAAEHCQYLSNTRAEDR